MRKVTAILLASLLAFGCLTAASAAAQPTLSLAAAQSGDRVTVTVSATNCGAACGVSFTLSYDAARLAFADWQQGAASMSAVAVFNGAYAPDTVRAAFAGTEPLTDGVLATITFSVKPSDKATDASFTFASFKFADENGDRIEGAAQNTALSIPAGGTASGSTSGGHTTVVVPPSEDAPVTLMQFSDVRASDWFYGSVQYVCEKGLMSGTAADTFAPQSTMTRAMLMTVLARYAGMDTAGGATWYKKGMAWAKANGISDGTNPSGNITREQLVTMLYRYEKSPAATGEITFSDADQISAWARDAVRWAVQTGVISGMGDGTLKPQGSATRAQVAAIFARLAK